MPTPTWPYPVGTLGTPWSDEDKATWLARQSRQRSYDEEVIQKLDKLAKGSAPFADLFEVVGYGKLSMDPERYPLVAAKSKTWAADKPTVLITGGVHGYETSGVQGAISFLAEHAVEHAKDFNFVVTPCVSPWGYEHIQRWTSQAVDPNRSFIVEQQGDKTQKDDEENILVDKNAGRTEESDALITFLETLPCKRDNITMHIDLHETTDTDSTEFRPAKAARDGVTEFDVEKESFIPDGFYLVMDSAVCPAEGKEAEVPVETLETQKRFYMAMLEKVRAVTHVCSDRKILDFPVVPEGGAVPVPVKSLNLCAGMTDAPYATTTEVYPDSAGMTGEICNKAQVACVLGGLEFLKTLR